MIGRIVTAATTKLSVLALCLLAYPALGWADSGYVDYNPQQAVEKVSAPLFVIIAYSIVWLAVIAFALKLWRGQRRIDAELAAMNHQLADLEKENLGEENLEHNKKGFAGVNNDTKRVES